MWVLASVAALTGLNQPTVAKVAKRLQSAGLLETRRGATGGYQLLDRPEDISLVHIVEAVEGPIAVNGCVDGTQDPCAVSNCCFMSSKARLRPCLGCSGVRVTLMLICRWPNSYDVPQRL